MRLAGKTAIVTGAAGGFGEGIARRFAAEGAKVVVVDVRDDHARRVAGEIGCGAIAIGADVGVAADVERVVTDTVRQLGPPDILVNNAGTTHRNRPLLEVDEDTFDLLFRVNVKSVFLFTRAIVPVMRELGGGVILNIGSTAGIRPRPGLTWYNATKGAVNLASKSLAVELAPWHIRVNAICPVIGETGLLEAFMGVPDTTGKSRALCRHHPARPHVTRRRRRQCRFVSGVGRRRVHHRRRIPGRRRPHDMSTTERTLLDLAHLRSWIGRTEEVDDLVTPRLAAEFRATFESHLAPVRDGEAPWTLQWCLTPPIAPTAALTDEGHIARGGFLPPVPLPRRMWAGGEIETRAPLRVGETVRRVSRVEDVAVKDGRTGQLCFVTVRHEYRAQGAVAIAERQDIVYRELASGGAPPSPAKAAAQDARKPQLAWTVDPTVPFLFRYSAMTFNAHRIHYDLPYVTETEGYPGLVVHGPLQASLLFNLAVTMSGAAPKRFSYRGLSPLIAGQPFQVCGARGSDGTLQCWTLDAAGRICMDAQGSP